MEFKTSFDLFTKIVTLIVILLFIAIGQNSIRNIISNRFSDLNFVLVQGGVIVLLIGIILTAYLFHPQKYIISQNQLMIKRPISTVVLFLDDIVEVEKLSEEDISGTIRTFGVGGLFGYFGKFYNSKIGNMTYFITHKKNLILLRTKDGRKVLTSPDNIEMYDYLYTKNNI